MREQVTRLYRWHIEEHKNDTGEKKLKLHGNVTGHPRFMDSARIHTSKLQEYYVDWEKGELYARTRNTEYRCFLEHWDFDRQEKTQVYGEQGERLREYLPEYDKVRVLYYDRYPDPEIEPGKVLLVLADYEEYYFHSLYYVPQEGKKRSNYTGYPHVGTFQDSYLITTQDYRIDLRYFPHEGNIEFYMEQTEGCPWFIENIGTKTLYARTSVGVLKLQAGERKAVCRENTEKEPPVLHGGDLYPAVW